SRAAVEQRVVILVDALNQFEPVARARLLSWLPRPWPENVRLIATAIPGQESQVMRERRGVWIEPLPPLDSADSRQIAAAVGRRYHREIHPRILEIILSKRTEGGLAAGNALWLNLALEE